MEYEVILPKKVLKELSRIPLQSRERIKKALVAIKYDPYFAKSLRGEQKGKLSYRVWPYRIIYRVDKKNYIVLIQHIRHRQGVYLK